MLVWMCEEQRGRRSRSTRGLPGGLPEGKERTEDQPEGGQGGSGAGGEPGEAAVAQGEGGTEPRCPRHSSKASILRHSAFFTVQLSHMTSSHEHMISAYSTLSYTIIN